MNIENNSREITIEDLAAMIAKGFGEQDKKFININEQLTGIRYDISILDQKFVTRKEFTELLIRLKFL